MTELQKNLAYGGVFMNVKVKALIRMHYGSYYSEPDSLIIDCTYKIRGFKKMSRYITLDSKVSNESYNNFISRIITRLESLSHDEVIELIKEKITSDIESTLKDKSTDEKLQSLLKDFNKIKFSFTIKDKL